MAGLEGIRPEQGDLFLLLKKFADVGDHVAWQYHPVEPSTGLSLEQKFADRFGQTSRSRGGRVRGARSLRLLAVHQPRQSAGLGVLALCGRFADEQIHGPLQRVTVPFRSGFRQFVHEVAPAHPVYRLAGDREAFNMTMRRGWGSRWGPCRQPRRHPVRRSDTGANAGSSQCRSGRNEQDSSVSFCV